MIKTALIGGITVILPVALLVIIFKWLLKIVTNIIQPFTNIITATAHTQELIADIIVIIILLLTCFIVGLVVKTKIGKFIHHSLEDNTLKFAPGYNMIKETIMQFLGKSKPPFSDVCLVQLFENSTMCTGFVTDTHEDGSYTVFVPTGPNPTSGLIYHVKGEFVRIVDVTVESAMRSILSCGAGSERLLSAVKNSH